MYGYLTDNYARYDVVEFSHNTLLEVAGKKHDRKDKIWREREQQLDELGLIDDGYAIPRPDHGTETLEDALPGQIHMLLRALCASENDKNVKKPKDVVTVEEAALLQGILTKKLSEYKTTLEADQKVLEALHSDAETALIPTGCNALRYSMALQVRIGEKEILRQLMTLCQSHIKAKSEETAARSTKRKFNDNSETHSKKTARKDKHR